MDDRTNMAFERIAGLTVKQSAFLMEYAKTENLSQACRVAGINRSTGYKYLENEDFQAALEQTKNKIVNAAWTKLSSQLEKAVDKVVAVLDDPKASVNARLRATELIFNYASRYADSRDILSRMERLEDSLNAADRHHSLAAPRNERYQEQRCRRQERAQGQSASAC